MRRWSVRPAQIAPVIEVADLQIDRGANVVELPDQLRVARRDEIRLDLTQVCGRTYEPSKSVNVDHASGAARTASHRRHDPEPVTGRSPIARRGARGVSRA